MAEQQDRDQRTEQATPQRLRRAREEGQIAYSAELVGGLILMTGVLLFWGVGRYFFDTLTGTMTRRFTYFDDVISGNESLGTVFIKDSMVFAAACFSFVIPVGIVAGLCGLLQTNFNFSTKPLQLDVSKLDIKKGFGRIFNSRSAVRGALSLVKAGIVLGIVYWVASSKIHTIMASSHGSFREMMEVAAEVALFASLAIAALLVIVGGIDFAYQRYKHLEDMKMSMQDIKDEHKESEGDPHIRARVKKLQAELGRKRMLSDVPNATVVVTNPTHFAVALQYDPQTMEAPLVLAKGADHLAKKIIEIAKENDVAVVERKPVARFLFANVNVGGAIPFEMYHAVAEILNFVNRMRSAA